METKTNLNRRHEERSQEAYIKRISFAQTYAFLYRRRKREGVNIAGIQVLAADLVGIGADSGSDDDRYKTQRSMSSRFMKDPTVEAELIRLGMLKNKVTGEWYDPRLA